MTSGYEIPENLSPEEERAIIVALERYLDERDARPSPWALAGRIEAAREGTLQSRRSMRRPWLSPFPFAHYGTEPIRGRGDSA